MQEQARRDRNTQRLGECFPDFAERVRLVIEDLQSEGFRPRIQDGYRTPADQLKAFNNGNSLVKFGFHNVTGEGGKKEALAVDLLDDDHPLASSRRYVIRLAAIADRHGLKSGIYFFNSKISPDKKEVFRAAIRQAVAAQNFDPKIVIGFDPTHIEATGLTIAQAAAGKRPG
jgi:hypothetical protein